MLLNHARANECRDVPRFKKEMSQLVDDALNNTLSLGKVHASLWIIMLERKFILLHSNSLLTVNVALTKANLLLIVKAIVVVNRYGLVMVVSDK